MIFQSFGAHLVVSTFKILGKKKLRKTPLTSTTDDKPKPTKLIDILFQFSECKMFMGGSLIQEIFRQIIFLKS